MRRAMISSLMAACLLSAAIGVVSAAPPSKTCPEGGSGWTSFTLDLDWEFGDGVPSEGSDAWWDMTLDGFAASGFTPQEAADLYELGSVEALYEFIQVSLRGLDKNGDGAICGKPFPEWQNGSPSWFFNATDGNARQH